MTSAASNALPRTFDVALVVDDHPLFCDALSMTLRSVAGIDRVETAGSLGAAIERLESGSPVDLVVLDLNLPDVSGLDGLLRLRAASNGTPLVVVSSVSDHRVMTAAVAAGARGFVPKHAGREVFRSALGRIAAGGVFLPDEVAVDDASAGPASARDEAMRRLSELTRQQARILDLICEGKMNKQIAWELAISEATVKAHVTAIMRKLGVLTRTQAVLLARESRFAGVLRD